MTATSARKGLFSGVSDRGNSRGSDRVRSSLDGVTITLNTHPLGAVQWLKEEVFWNQFGRRPVNGYGKLVRIHKLKEKIASWQVMLDWLQSGKLPGDEWEKPGHHLNGEREGTLRCDLNRCSLQLFVQIHSEEVIFLLHLCEKNRRS